MKRALVTICTGSFASRLAEVTHPTMAAYAKRIGADFVVWDDRTQFPTPYKRSLLADLLETYDRALYLDADVLVRDDAPDVFSLVPEDLLGLHEEGQYHLPYVLQSGVMQIMQALRFDHMKWDGSYYNLGVMVLSRQHCRLFAGPPRIVGAKEPAYWNALLAMEGIKVLPLSHRFNRLPVDGYYGQERFDAYFLNPACLDDVDHEQAHVEQLSRDLGHWRASAPAYRFQQRFGFLLPGELKGQLAALPTIRYAQQVLFPEDQVVVVGERPERLAELGVQAFSARDQVPNWTSFRWLPIPREVNNAFDACPGGELFHPVARYAVETLGSELPFEHRRLRLEVRPDALASVREKVAGHDPARLVLLHAGRVDVADTLDGSFWWACLKVLLGQGLQVVLVGDVAPERSNAGDCLAVLFDTQGALDLTNRLTLSEIVALCSLAPVVITNDSPVLSIAGAFDGWLGLVAASRPAEFVLPWREGTPFHRARVLAPETYDPLQPGTLGVERRVPDDVRLLERIPSPVDVAQFATEALQEVAASAASKPKQRRTRAIVTICCGKFFERYAQHSHSTMRAYAEKIGADFIVWDDYTGFSMPHYKKFQLGKLLDEYERVLYVDTDVIIRPDAPDIFEVVPEDQLGMHEEGQYYPPFERQYITVRMMQKMGIDSDGWDGRYFNSGVMVLSQAHRGLFTPPNEEPDNLKEQTLLNVLIWKTRTPVFPLPHRFNRMCMMDWRFGEERFDSYFLHYAGLKEPWEEDEAVQLMGSDIQRWRDAAPEYRFRRYFGFEVKGDLSAQLAALPTFRLAYQVLFPGAFLAFVSDRPELLAELGLAAYASRESVPNVRRYHWFVTERRVSDPLVRRPDGPLMHPIQRYCVESLGVELPLDFRQMPLVARPDAISSLEQKLPPSAGPLVVLHAARPAGGLAAPVEFWQACLNALAARGIAVAVVGNRAGGEFPAWPLDVTRGIDLVDRLSLAEMVGLASKAGVILSGESPLVMIAGGFFAWIGLVAPSRPPDFVLPWRQGSPLFRATVFERPDLPPEAIHSIQARSKGGTAPRWPEVGSVVDFVIKTLATS